VTYVQTGGSPALLVSASGLVTTSGTLAPGTYVATGTTSDPNDDTGTFALTLDVGKLIQSVSTTVSVKVSGSPALPRPTHRHGQRRRGDLRPDERYSLIGREHERSRHDERGINGRLVRRERHDE